MKNNIIKKIKTLILSFLCIHIFILNLSEIPTNINNNSIYNFLYQYRVSLNNIDIRILLLLVIIYYFFYNIKDNKKNNILLPIILSIISIIGKCYLTADSSLSVLWISPVQIYKSILLTASYIITYYYIIKLLSNINILNIKLKISPIERIWRKHPILITLLTIIICWLPYIIIFYPGGSSGDTIDSIFQFFHLDGSWSMESINLISKSIYINKHHSVLFTVILSLFIKLGLKISTFNFGFFLYILFQLIIVITIFTFMIYYLKKINIPFWIIICSLLLICFSPTIIEYALTAVKDTLNASFTLLYIIFLFQMIRNYNSIINNKLRLTLLIIIMLLIMLLRNNGIFTIILSFPLLMFIYKNKKKKILEIFFLVILLFISYNNILLPSLKVSNGSIREVLSIPVMQIARTVKYQKETIPKNDIKTINKVLDFEEIIDKYDPNIADGVKNTYKKKSTKKENIELLKIWFKYLKRYPLIYIDSFLNSTYGYFYPIFFAEDMDVSKHYQLKEAFPSNEIFQYEKEELNTILALKYQSLFTSYFNVVGVLDLFLLFLVIKIINNKNYKYLIPLSPLLATLLVCLASPVNGCPRYILPIFFSLPILLSIYYYNEKKL